MPVATTDPATAAEVLREELRAAALANRGRVADAAGELTPGYAQLPQFQALDERLARMAQAVADRHTSQQMDAHVLEVEPAVNGWGMGLSDDVDDAERRLMAYPLAHLLLDTQRLQDRVRATVVAVQAAHAAQRAATPATPVQVDPAYGQPAPAKQPVAQAVAPQASPANPGTTAKADVTGGKDAANVGRQGGSPGVDVRPAAAPVGPPAAKPAGELPLWVPPADAATDTGDDAFVYSAPRGGRGGTPPSAETSSAAEVNIPDMRKLGEALARPKPTARPGVSASAARSRSTTAKRPTKPAAGSTEQAGHLRRRGAGPEQPKPRKPQR